MSEENVLQLELEKLDVAGLKRVAQVWNITKIGKDKKSITGSIIEAMQDEFYLKGVLEKLSSTQVTIYTSILKSRTNILTLGEISRKISLPPVNAEMELGVLKRYFLAYQRKNRERLTNSMDKYYYYPETGDNVVLEANDKGQKFNIDLSSVLKEKKDNPPEEWIAAFQTVTGESSKRKNFSLSEIEKLKEPEVLQAFMDALSEPERDLILECFQQGGILEIQRAREFIQGRKGKWEELVRRLHALGILLDEYYIDEKFIRILTMPVEIFKHLQDFPLLPKEKKGTKKRQEKTTVNDLDFYLNIKKMIVYISRKGLNLAKSGKIKQVDLKETENRLLRPDIGLFIEKSQIYQIELLLPVMRLLDIVRIKRDDVVLRNDYDAILEKSPFELMDQIIKEMAEARHRRIRYEDVFEPMYVPFFDRKIFDECVNQISRVERAMYFVVMATMIRESLVLSKTFRIKNFQEDLQELRREITSALFYLQLLGLVTVEYPDRWITLSNLGLFYMKNQNLEQKDEKGGIIINPDLSLIAIPERLSIEGVELLKSFAELKSFDNVYTFQINRESFQEGLLLKRRKEEFLEFLQNTCKNDLPQNLTFSVDDWSRSIPLVTITDECVVVQTQEVDHMELLMGQLSGKKIVIDRISPTTILIDQDKIYETIGFAEKLGLIIRLVR